MTGDLRRRLAWWAAAVAALELVLLRIGTRTFVHIPGLDLVEGPLAVVAEAGRIAYHLAVVLAVALLIALLVTLATDVTGRNLVLMGALGMFVTSAGLAATGAASPAVTGWLSLTAVGIPALVTIRDGRQALPLVLWAGAFGLMGAGTLLQGLGGGLTGGDVGTLLAAGDVVAVAAAVSLPLLLGTRPSRSALVGGLVTAVVVAGLLWRASSTTAILVLWSFGVPASLPSLLYGIAAGAAVSTVWSAIEMRRRSMAAAVLLLVAGGLALISTYQTALVVTGLILAAVETGPGPTPRPAAQAGTGEAASLIEYRQWGSRVLSP